MQQRLSRFGVGPRLSAAVALCSAAAFAVVRLWPEVCTLRSVPYDVVAPLGWTFVAAGAVMWIAGLISAHHAYNCDRLTTSGVFAMVRHPIYGSWIVFTFPGIALLTRSWPWLLVSLAAYAVFRRVIHIEEDYLAERFGQEYLDYRSRVNAVLPMPRKKP